MSYNSSPHWDSYIKWDAANPQFYPLFVRFTLELIERGYKKFGVRLIWERIRWESFLQTQGDPWKLNDHYHSIYARRFMEEHPEHKGVFRLRTKNT